MNTNVNNSRQPLLWIVGVAIVLFCAAGIAAIMGWVPTSIAGGNSSTLAAAPAPAPTKTSAPAQVANHHAEQHNRVDVASNTPVRTTCRDCGVIESVREISEPGKGSGVGGVSGAVVGGVLGHQVGNGRGNDLATVAGAIGGAFAGNAIEKRVNATKSYEVIVRFEGGSSRTFNLASSTWRSGDRVRVVDDVIRSNG